MQRMFDICSEGYSLVSHYSAVLLLRHTYKKGKVQPRRVHVNPEEEQRYSSTISSVIDRMGGQRDDPAALTSGE
jgi:hypothetical protein